MGSSDKPTGPCLLAIDLGTSAVKTGLFRTSGLEIASAAAQYPTDRPRPTWAEQDPEQWWKAAAGTIRDCLEKADIRAEQVAAVSVSGQAPSCVALDRDGRPIRPAILWIDRRATDEVQWMADNIGAETVANVSGNWIDGYFGGPKWLWYRLNEPGLFQQTWKIVQAHSYVSFKLCGEIVTDYSQAGLCSPCFDLKARRWSVDMCEALSIPLAMLPELAPSHQVIGRVHAEGALATGLVAGTPLVTGAGDFACATLGCGVTEVGQAAQMLGTAGNLIVPVGSEPNPDPRLLNTVHATGEYLTLGSTYAGGVIQWFRAELATAEIAEAQSQGMSAFQLLDKRAEDIPAGSEGLILLPYFMGERTPIWDPHARGVYVGLTPYHTRAHMYRAALEGVAYGFRHMAEIIEERGVSIGEVIAVNGGARSAVWRQIFADVLNATIRHYVGGASTLLGDVALAGLGVSLFSSLDVVHQWQKIVEIEEPRPSAHEVYGKYYRLYRDTYDQLKPIFLQLSNVSQETT